ncbi:hypothetical protein [Amycolatopsis thermophila]|uniref:SurA N-terminal domain-containing protein n=1 Tax=Amycolatopsis thermophila TaxID=206084 RepID=A0ABU0EV54_9PSEU|nr:hypothetical protein [Amycolatopsis thermophila]MDQ0379151.1 hypothetical protein [Amycolatopsis thermophila]
MGRSRSLLVALTGCLVLAGCGSGPSQVGAAVISGDRVTTVDQVQDLLDKAVREQPAAQQLSQQRKLDLLGRELVRQLVIHDAIVRAAQREGLVADPQLLEQTLANDPLASPVPTTATDPSQLAQQVANRVRDHREVITDSLLLQALGQKYVDRLSVTFDYTSVVSDDGSAQPVDRREKAIAKAEQMAASPAAAAEVIRADAAAGQQTSVGESVPAAQAPALATMVLFGVEPGTVVAFQPSQEQEVWIVAIVRQRDLTTPAVTDQAAQPTGLQLAGIGQRLLQPDIDQAGVRVNPRYGVWDPVAMNLAPSSAETAGVVLPVKGAAQP